MNSATYKNHSLECHWKALHYFSFHPYSIRDHDGQNRYTPSTTRPTAYFPGAHSSAHSIRTELLLQPLALTKTKAFSPVNPATVQTFHPHPTPARESLRVHSPAH